MSLLFFCDVSYLLLPIGVDRVALSKLDGPNILKMDFCTALADVDLTELKVMLLRVDMNTNNKYYYKM